MYIRKTRQLLPLAKILITIVCGAILLTFPKISQADTVSWISGEPSVVRTEQRKPVFDPNCELMLNVKVNDKTASYLCEHQGRDIRLYQGGGTTAISIGSDTKVYPLHGSQFNTVLPGTNTAFSSGGGQFTIEKDMTNSLRGLIVQQKVEYTYSHTPDFKASWSVRNYGYSQNGKWMALHVEGVGLVRLNVETFEVKRFAQVPYAGVTLHISNDGRLVTMSGGSDVPFTVFELSDGCGDVIDPEQTSESLPLQNACPGRSLADMPRTTNYGPYRVEFSDDNGLITYLSTPSANGGVSPDDIETWTTIKAPRYVVSSQLDYLAMGDSYSSGEGDIGKKPDGTSYYTPVSDYAGGCHLSERSYPFILRARYDMSTNGMKSVACSGAETKDIKAANDAYFGQGGRLKDLGNADRTDRQKRALDIFNPGYVEQVQFVKKYKPKAVTLTIGGNDVEFAKKLEKCASEKSTCEFVSNDHRKAAHAYEIKNQFFKLKSLYKELRDVSSQTKIYVVGYPSFINPEEWRKCGYDDGHLSGDEKVFIDESLKYMNQIIEAAAVAAGVKYINIEDSLNGGRICDVGGEYMTGLHDTWFNRSSELFHPNAAGHEKIAQAISDQLGEQSLLDYSYSSTPNDAALPPEPTDYFKSSTEIYDGARVASYQMTDDVVTKGQSANIVAAPFTYREGSQVYVSIFSDPINLGALSAQSNGSVNAQVAIPSDVPAGYHTLVLSGKTYSGEPLELYQIVLVQGSGPNDRDEDGIDDIHDSCMFIEPANEDKDTDGIDDMCDPEIDLQSYRVRSGDASRIYNGSPEIKNYIYIERNISASDITGVAGDDDPDDDGWAIVAASRGKMYSHTTVPDIGPIANDKVTGEGQDRIPHVYIRAGDHGCVEYVPSSLSKVLPGEVRTLKLVAINTNKCRKEVPTVDADGNGLPDNTQPLYRARNGNPAIQHMKPNGTKFYENPRKLYLFRNFYAAEAQLGISDYSPTGTAAGREAEPIQQWNLLTASQSILNRGTYSKLVILSGVDNKPQPTILVKNSIFNIWTICTALQPRSTATIQSTTQYRNDFKLLLIPPGGHKCE